ncbi:hypothetical protein LAZ67_7002895 [Cordylochernes scorpioides]|uniref:Uncharacterized protein n=1 Tax=Cordylochernes scorpioides TaxID=51811 RepID=A0ABY6KNF3_9ARAC|nr:hypothetical protein LAZ67_7002895 [Cordylochernes scorpioides]
MPLQLNEVMDYNPPDNKMYKKHRRLKNIQEISEGWISEFLDRLEQRTIPKTPPLPVPSPDEKGGDGTVTSSLINLGSAGPADSTLSFWRDAALSRSTTFEWFSRFLKGREKVNDDQHNGRPRSLRCEENKLKIK